MTTRMIHVAILNESTVLNNTTDIKPIVAALQTQVNRDFYPTWGTPATLVQVWNHPPVAPPGHWQLVFLDDADQAGALGYHDVTNEGLPLGKVFAKTTLQYGEKVSVTASHELLEMLVDPEINLTALLETADGPVLYAYESCDPVEADSYGYDIDGVRVSDFLTPAWFGTGSPGPFDFQKACDASLQILPGGYMSVLRLNGSSLGWQQLTAHGQLNPRARGPVGSRRERRRTSRSQWVISERR